jgi:hypothetical protein
MLLLSKAEIGMFAYIEYPATSKRTNLRRLDEEEVCLVVTINPLVSVTFCCSASTKDSLVEVDLLPAYSMHRDSFELLVVS